MTEIFFSPFLAYRIRLSNSSNVGNFLEEFTVRDSITCSVLHIKSIPLAMVSNNVVFSLMMCSNHGYKLWSFYHPILKFSGSLAHAFLLSTMQQFTGYMFLTGNSPWTTVRALTMGRFSL